MKFIDLSGSERIAAFVQMAKEMARANTPDAALGAFMKGTSAVHNWGAVIHVTTCDLPPNEYAIVRFNTIGGHEKVPRADLPGMDPRPDAHQGGIIGELVGTPEPKVVHNLDIKDDPVMGDALAGFRSVEAVPMFFRGDPADWILLFHDKPEAANVSDLEEMILGSNLIGNTINTSALNVELSEANTRIQREVENIAEIQRALLPQTMPEIPGLDIAAHYETFDRAGGDYYDFLPLRNGDDGPDPNGPWALIIADASGHGPAAAVVMAMVHTLFHSYDRIPSGPAQFIEHINANLPSNRVHYSFVTAWLGIYDPVTRHLRYASAGHDAPILMCPDHPDNMQRLDGTGGYPLGVEARTGTREGAITLNAGQTLVLYTDGITEAVSPDDEMFRIEGIEKALVTCNGEPTCVILEVVDALKEHEAGVRARDDQTIVALQLTGD